MRIFVLLVLLGGGNAGTLLLKGGNSELRFEGGSTKGDAVLTATCDVAPSVKLIVPNTISIATPPAPNITAWLHNVPPTCASSPLDAPCATSLDSNFPPFFYCVLTGEGGEYSMGPFHARPVFETHESQVLGVAVQVECPTPDWTILERIMKDDASAVGLDPAPPEPTLCLTACMVCPHGPTTDQKMV